MQASHEAARQASETREKASAAQCEELSGELQRQDAALQEGEAKLRAAQQEIREAKGEAARLEGELRAKEGVVQALEEEREQVRAEGEARVSWRIADWQVEGGTPLAALRIGEEVLGANVARLALQRHHHGEVGDTQGCLGSSTRLLICGVR